MTLTREEQETCILLNADNREIVHVYSNDPIWQRKLERAGAVITKEYPSGGKEYQLQYKQITIRKIAQPKSMTEEQRQAARERFKKVREARKISE